MPRQRARDADRTLKRPIDVARAFREAEGGRMTLPDVHAGVPHDAVPVLTMTRAEVPWDLVGERASQILLRVDGRTCASMLADQVALPIADVAEQLERLVGLGIVYVVTPSLPACDTAGDVSRPTEPGSAGRDDV